MEREEPRVLGVHVYVDNDGRELTVVQIHPDAQSMDTHPQIAGERIHEALVVVDNTSIEVYGEPGPVTQVLLEQLGATGLPINVKPKGLGGFARLAAA